MWFIHVLIVGKTSITNAKGRFVFDGLGEGTYRVSPDATKGPFSPTKRDVTLSNTSQADINFAKVSPRPTSSAPSPSGASS